ncbi:DUF6882 domain-containing protein [Microbacterium trichothecenolyticum]|uniref:DUF6882 domain-containing protein n=1 Tax=Microbacterium trichothecenolyticum TaxID=69370 RepID=UPI0035BE86D7
MIWKRRSRDQVASLTPELRQLIVECHVETLSKQQRAVEQWGIGTADHWSADLAAGTLSFEFPDRIVAGRVQLLGSYAITPGTWLWGWANGSVPEPVTGASLEVKAIATRPGLQLLHDAKLQIPAEFADDLANVAVEVAGLDGWYRAPSATNYVYLGFTDLEVRPL